jgi:uncharacterized Zn finger protein
LADADFFDRAFLWSVLREVPSANKCSLCGQDDLVPQGVISTPYRPVAGMPESNIDCLVVVCNSCGNVRWHAISAIRQIHERG